MAYWLFKQEPDDYSYSDLERDGVATWDGVTNNAAQKNLRAVSPGDKVFFYHTGDEKAIVGTMTVSVGPARVDEKNVVVQVKPLKRLKTPVTLAAIKADVEFAAWELVRISRLSVMPVTPEIWNKILEMAK
jgi:predicted RNA-binding protein with PUA-like domain